MTWRRPTDYWRNSIYLIDLMSYFLYIFNRYKFVLWKDRDMFFVKEKCNKGLLNWLQQPFYCFNDAYSITISTIIRLVHPTLFSKDYPPCIFFNKLFCCRHINFPFLAFRHQFTPNSIKETTKLYTHNITLATASILL